jgi:uncharacterized protein YutE (UPF0331/DUF86 family)
LDSIVENKAAIVERCLQRIHEEYGDDQAAFLEDFTRQDSVILNLERAAQACLDLGAHMIRTRRLGIPQTSRDIFRLLEQHGLIPKQLSENLQAMVGFRNIAVHSYQELEMQVVCSIVETKLRDFTDFTSLMLKIA